MQRTRYRILVLDPSPGLAALLDGTDGLLAKGRAIDARMDGLQPADSAGVETMAAGPPDAVMLDPVTFTLPPQDQIPRLHACFGLTRPVCYASGESPSLARTCLALGFRAFLSKSATLETIRLGLSAVRAGAVLIDAAHAGAITTLPDDPAPTRSLTEREVYALKSVARGKSLREIGHELVLSKKTVETYKAWGTSKLNISGRREIVEYAIRAGWA